MVWRRALWDLAGSVPREHWDTWMGPDGGNWNMGGILSDVGRATRSLGKAPAFTTVVILTLGLGIGTTTAIYSVAHGVLLAPLPYPEPDRIVSIRGNYEGTNRRFSVSYVNARDWKEAQETLDGIALLRGGALTLTGTDQAEQLSVLFADGEYFEILGAQPVVGRLFGVDDNRIPGGHAIVVLSYDAWQTRFGEDPSIVGSAINLSGTPFPGRLQSGSGYEGCADRSGGGVEGGLAPGHAPLGGLAPVLHPWLVSNRLRPGPSTHGSRHAAVSKEETTVE